ncbi:MAG: coproporphyrinogen dehydrogenase HemZ [Lachnospiraceae bacterium]
MIYLEQNNEMYNNDIRAMLQAFFDNEKIITNRDGERISLVVTYLDNRVSYHLSDEKGYEDEGDISIEYENKQIARNPLKAVLYHMLSKYTGKELPWGSMTGVRPTKIATSLLEQGVCEEDIHKVYTDTYLTIDQKADICIEVARREQEIFKDYHYQEEYCLYVGIPFCPSRCLYCSFTSYPIAMYNENTGKNKYCVEDYLQALYKEMEYVAKEPVYKKKRLVAVYIGGGTPSALRKGQLEELVKMIQSTFDMQYVREFCVECGRPDSITKEKLEVLKSLGVDRISINPQTMWDETLALIGRAHTVKETKEAFKLARETGFDNINMDIIVGLPGEDMKHVEHTLEEIHRLAPDSLTVHSLAIKRAANLNIEMERYHNLIKGSTNEMLLAVDQCARDLDLYPYYLYRQKNIPGKLENIGYSKKGKECSYNILIMEEKMDILALGAGSSSKFVFYKENRIERVENVKNVDEYICRIDEMIDRKRKMFQTLEV